MLTKEMQIFVMEGQYNSLDLYQFIDAFEEQRREKGISELWLSKYDVLKTYQQILSIVVRLEECGISYRDIRTNDILIDGNLKVTRINFCSSRNMEEEIVELSPIFDALFPILN